MCAGFAAAANHYFRPATDLPFRGSRWNGCTCLVAAIGLALLAEPASGQESDIVRTPNHGGFGIQKSLDEQIGAGRGDPFLPDSSRFLIARDPFRAITRGRQIFQRKFSFSEGLGPRTGDGVAEIRDGEHLAPFDASVVAGFADSCAGCHGRPRGSAGHGGTVFTRPGSRDAPDLFGLGLQEMLADEITSDLRAIRDRARQQAADTGAAVEVRLHSKGIDYGELVALPDGTLDPSRIEGVDSDLRVKPFFAEGSAFSIRQFTVGAFNDEMGLEAADPDVLLANQGERVVTPSGMVLDGGVDVIEPPAVTSPSEDTDGDGIVNELDPSLVDFVEFYLLNYFKPGRYDPYPREANRGRALMEDIGCTSCHVPDLQIEHDRRVADVETVFSPDRAGFNSLFSSAEPLYASQSDGTGHADLKPPSGNRFVVRSIFTDFKRHDLGPNFAERDFDGMIRHEFMTEPLWGVATTAPYGHDGRSVNLREVILRHGGEAQAARDAFSALSDDNQLTILGFLSTLVLFPPQDTASNLDSGDPSDPHYPQYGHGSIALSVLFNDPAGRE